jgi:hypothetical protein
VNGWDDSVFGNLPSPFGSTPSNGLFSNGQPTAAFYDPSAQFTLAARNTDPNTPSAAGGMPMDPRDREALIRTVYGEASDQPPLGQAGVAAAILNRLHAGGYSAGAPNTIANIVTAPAAGFNPKRGFKEFSPWNAPGVPESNPIAQHLSPNDPNQVLANAYRNIGSIVDKVYNGLIPDPTGGATHYLGRWPANKPMPKWFGPLAAQNKVKIGDQTFVGGATGPGQAPIVVGALGGGLQ